MDKHLLAVASGRTPADLVIQNGRVVNVYSGEVYPGGVAVAGDKIAAVGDVAYCIGPDTRIVDAEGHFLLPGFVDGHIHPESTGLSIRNFAELVLGHGTTVIMADLHEFGVVGGLPAIQAILDEAADTDLKIYFVVPSHVPFAPDLETSGAKFTPETIRTALGLPDAVGLSECVGGYILSELPALLESMDDCLRAGGTLQGHLPGAIGPVLNACVAAGVSTDHESVLGAEAVERVRAGCHVMIREGSMAHNLEDCLPAVLPLDTSLVSLVTDDLHTCDAMDFGHLDETLRKALAAGANFVTAVQMVSLNNARAFGLEREIGGLAPGRRADINITTGPEDFRVLSVFAGGRQVLKDGVTMVHYPAAVHAPCLLDTMRLKKPVTAKSLTIAVPETAKSARVLAMQALPGIFLTKGREAVLPVRGGSVCCDVAQDLLHIAQVERYGHNGNIGKAFMGGFGLKSGAIASSVGHDNHNIIVLGADPADMALAVNRVAELGGGQVLVESGRVVTEIAYPIGGLLCDLPARELAEKKRIMNQALAERGCQIQMPLMYLSFVCLVGLPIYSVTDRGFINGVEQRIMDPVLELSC